jgi:thiamine pyrophosphate-dependent acetolactate synthase large subunit-like protein
MSIRADSETVAEAVARALAGLGVGHVFGVVGSGNFALTNELRAQGIPFTATRHEGGAATMADAYSRMSGKLGVVTTHQGCGLTNATTGIGEAAKSRTPLLVLTADSATGQVRSNFRIDQDGLARSLGATAERVHTPASAITDTVRAYRTAVNERRTVVFSLPIDIQRQPFPGPIPPLRPVRASSPVRPGEAAVAELAEVLDRAQRPVFVAGRGARDAGAEIAALAEDYGALLATSAVAHGLFAGHPFGLGISGGFASPLAAELISTADLVVGWGCLLNMWTTRHGALIHPDATVVQVDVEDAALGANRRIDLGVLGDAGETAAAVQRSGRGRARTGYRTPEVERAIAERVRWNDVAYEEFAAEDLIDPRTLSRDLDAMLPAERIVAVDSGNFMGYPSAYLSVPDQFGFCFTQAFQSIGLGLYTAIGAALARPDRLPVAAVGDGGFLMSVAELETVVRLGLPMVVVVYNDSAYGAEVHHFGGPGVDLTPVTFPPTDLAAIARGFGAEGVTVRAAADLGQVRRWLDGPRDRPLVVDAKIAGDGGSWWLAEAFKGH